MPRLYSKQFVATVVAFYDHACSSCSMILVVLTRVNAVRHKKDVLDWLWRVKGGEEAKLIRFDGVSIKYSRILINGLKVTKPGNVPSTSSIHSRCLLAAQVISLP